MPKRKAVKQLEREDSGLTPPPDGLLDTKPEEPNGPVNRLTTKVEDTEQEIVENSPKKAVRTRKTKVKVEAEAEDDDDDDVAAGAEKTPKAKAKGRTAVKKEVQVKEETEGNGDIKTVKKKRQSKADKEAEMVANPLSARTIGHKLFIGAHVSASGGQSADFKVLYKLKVDRRPQFDPEQCTHWSQCVRPFLEVSAKMGEP